MSYSHYFDANPVTPRRLSAFTEKVEGEIFKFISDSSTFSRKRLDFGSRLLVEAALKSPAFPKEGKVLDLGCGWGPVGIILKKFRPGIQLSFSDINSRALEQAKVNYNNNIAAEEANFYVSDGLKSVPGNFDLILMNPPIRAGKSVVYRLYREAYKALYDGGALMIVVQKKQGADTTKVELRRLFGDGQVEDIARKSGYRIYLARKNRSVSEPDI